MYIRVQHCYTLNARAPQSPRAPQGPRGPHRPDCHRQRRLLADGLYVESSQRLPWPEGPPVRVQLQSPPHTVKGLPPGPATTQR